MIDPQLLRDLCCPETHQPLAPVDRTVIERINEQIATGRLRNRAGKPVSEKFEGGLVRQDGKIVYPIRNQLPILLIDEAVEAPSAP